LKIVIIGIGQIAPEVLWVVAQGLEQILPETKCLIVGDVLAIPMHAFDVKRKQYNSSLILNDVHTYRVGRGGVDRLLGLVDADIYVSGLNYVFGEAYAPGIAGLVSLTRLKPEFYNEATNDRVFLERLVKEAVHEVGHTLGLQHCHKKYCVLHFSNSIFEVDKKTKLIL
jgi:archaemetzincin